MTGMHQIGFEHGTKVIGRLAEAAKRHRNTITNIETAKYAGDLATLAAVGAVLRQFIDENGGGPGVRLQKRRTSGP
jgi:hypothetical protein